MEHWLFIVVVRTKSSLIYLQRTGVKRKLYTLYNFYFAVEYAFLCNVLMAAAATVTEVQWLQD